MVGNTHFCCHTQLSADGHVRAAHIQPVSELRTNIGFSGVPHSHLRQRVCTSSLYPWILRLRVRSTIILGITSTFAVCEGIEGLDDEAWRVPARDDDDDALDWHCVFFACIASGMTGKQPGSERSHPADTALRTFFLFSNSETHAIPS